MTARKAAWTAFAIGAVLILAFYFTQPTQSTPQQAGSGGQSAPAAATDDQGNDQDEEQVRDETESQAEGSQDTSTTTDAPVDSPAGVDLGNGFAQVSPDADQAPVQPEAVQYDRQEITMPVTPTPDTQDPAAVADAFLTVYNSRSTESDESWQETTEAWLVPDLAAQLALGSNGALEGKTPAAVHTVEIGDNVEDWGIDTPLRWSRHVQVTVDTQDQGTYLLEYRIRSQLTEQGWLINTAPLDTWQRVED